MKTIRAEHETSSASELAERIEVDITASQLQQQGPGDLGRSRPDTELRAINQKLDPLGLAPEHPWAVGPRLDGVNHGSRIICRSEQLHGVDHVVATTQ